LGIALDQPSTFADCDCLCARIHAKFVECVADISFDGIGGQVQLVANLTIGETIADKDQNLELALAKSPWRGSDLLHALYDDIRHSRVQYAMTGSGGTQIMTQLLRLHIL